MNRVQLLPLEHSVAAAVIGDRVRTCRGFAITIDGELMGVAGIYRENDRWIAFSDLTPQAFEVRKQLVGKRAAAMAIARFRTLLARINGPVMAMPDERLEGSKDVLMRLGFRHVARGVYQCRA